jgi:hypothetical protein
LDFGVSISKTNHNIKTHITFRIITHLIKFCNEYELKCPSPILHCLLYLLNINLKGFWNNFFLGSFLAMTMHCTSNLLHGKKKKNGPTIERGKIWIPFIKLGVRPTSTLGPKRDQLVSFVCLGPTMLLRATCAPLDHCFILRIFLEFF